MGYLSAVDMLEHTDIDSALSWHMKANCYPPIPDMMFDTLKLAIEEVNDYHDSVYIGLPEGVLYKGMTQAKAIEIVDAHRLEAFIERY